MKSALGLHESRARTLAFPEARKVTVVDPSHVELLERTDVYQTIRGWLDGA